MLGTPRKNITSISTRKVLALINVLPGVSKQLKFGSAKFLVMSEP